MHRTMFLFLIAALSFGCDRSREKKDDPPVAVSATNGDTTGGAATPDDSGETPAAAKAPGEEKDEEPPGVETDDGVQRWDELVAGKPRQHWLDTWGPADSQTRFFVKDGPHEYQIELLNVFSKDDPDFEKVEIQEDTWDEDGYTFVLWSFRKSAEQPWEAVQAMSYVDGIEF